MASRHTLRKMAAELIAAKLFEKFNIEDMLKPGGLTTGPLTGWLKGVFGIGESAPELQPVACRGGADDGENHRRHRGS